MESNNLTQHENLLDFPKVIESDIDLLSSKTMSSEEITQLKYSNPCLYRYIGRKLEAIAPQDVPQKELILQFLNETYRLFGSVIDRLEIEESFNK